MGRNSNPFKPRRPSHKMPPPSRIKVVDESEPGDNYQDWLRTDLVDHAKKLGIPTWGTKDQIIARLRSDAGR